jgi:voltage-gated potassium channel
MPAIRSVDVDTFVGHDSLAIGAPVRGYRWHRGTLTSFIDRHTRAWESVTAGLTIAYVVLAFFEDSTTFELTPYTLALFCLSALFLLEFGARLWDAPSRRHYVRGHWIDLLTSVPLVGPLRALRLLRLLRFFRLQRSLRSLVTGGNVSSSWLIGPFLLLFWTGSAYGLWLAEHTVNPAISSFNSALMYALLTAGTVGYGGFTPISNEGKLICGGIVFVAIGLVGFASSRLTAMILDQKEGQLPMQVAAIERDTAQIKEMLTDLLAGSRSRAQGESDLIAISRAVAGSRGDN